MNSDERIIFKVVLSELRKLVKRKRLSRYFSFSQIYTILYTTQKSYFSIENTLA